MFNPLDTFGFRPRLNGALIGLCCVIGASVVCAQTANSSAPDIARTEAALWGAGGVEDVGKARAVLEAAAISGDPDAQYHLCRHLVNGWVIEQDKSRGFSLLEAAAAAKNTAALVALGEEYLWGINVPADPARAVGYLETASGLGDLSAKRILGEQYVSGDLLARDVDRGTDLLQDAIGAGDVEAEIALGKLYLNGIGVMRDQGKALDLFEAAAKAGNGHGLAAYDDALMWAQGDPAQAEAILNRAGEMKATEAWVSLAHGAMYGYLGGGRVSRAKFNGYAEKARKAGEEKIAVLEAERSMWGINVRASGPVTLSSLRAAAEAGNATAAGFLIELLRDGNNLNVRRRPDEALAALAEYGALFSEKRREQYAMSIKAAKARQLADFTSLADDFKARSDLRSSWFGTQIAKANLNVAFYILQQKLASEGLYGGPINGYATRSTLRAASRACQKLNLNARCADNVLHPGVVGALLTR